MWLGEGEITTKNWCLQGFDVTIRLGQLSGEEIYGQREQKELDESYKQSLANKKERENK